MSNMYLRRNLKVNMLLDLMDEQGGCIYKSVIQEIAPDSIVIGPPMKGMGSLLLPKGSTWRLGLALDDTVVSFSSRVLGRKEGDNI